VKTSEKYRTWVFTNEDSRARNKWGRVTEKKAAGGKKRSAGAARKEGHP